MKEKENPPTLKDFEQAGELADGEYTDSPCDTAPQPLRDYLLRQKSLLRHAVEEEPLPADLMPAVRRILAAGEKPRWTAGFYAGWAAAVIFFSAALWQTAQLHQLKRQQTVLAEFVRDHQRFAGRTDLMQFNTRSGTRAAGWLNDHLGFTPPLPAKYRRNMVGVRLCGVMGKAVGLLMYDHQGVPVTLYVLKAGNMPLPQADTPSLRVKSWQRHDITYIAIAPKKTGGNQGFSL